MARRTLPSSFEEMCERYGVRGSGVLLIRELKYKRTEREGQARELLERGKLSAAEERRFDTIVDERDDLDELVTQAEERLEDARRGFDDDDRRGGRGGRGRDNAPAMYFHTADGRKVRAVRHGESFSEASGTADKTKGGADGEDLSLGRALVGILRGDHQIMEREMRAQAVGVGPSGGFFVMPTLAGMFIDLARAQSAVSQAGAVTIPLNSGETRILRTTVDPVAAWKGEGSSLNDTEIKFGAVTLFPKVLGCIAEISEELIEDGANAAAVIQSTLAAAVADQLDRSFWRGVSGGAGDNDVTGRTFTGVLDDPDVNVVDMAGAAPTDYDEWIDAIQLVEDANGMPDVRIDAPRTAGQLAKLKETGTGAYLKAPDSVAALQYLKTTQTPVTLGGSNNQSASVVGNFASAFVVIGMRTQFHIEVSNQAGDAFENLTRKVRIWGRADMAIGRPQHLSLIKAIGPTS